MGTEEIVRSKSNLYISETQKMKNIMKCRKGANEWTNEWMNERMRLLTNENDKISYQ